MTKNEWLLCNDPVEMLTFLWEQEPFLSLKIASQKYPIEYDWQDYLALVTPLHKYYLATARNIWKFLPQEESRKSIELAELFVAGSVPWDQVSRYNYYTEAAAFTFDDDSSSEDVAIWAREVENLSEETMRKMVNSPEPTIDFGARELLSDAAYFVDEAMMYPCIAPMGPPRSGTQFMWADTLREHVSYPISKNS